MIRNAMRAARRSSTAVFETLHAIGELRGRRGLDVAERAERLSRIMMRLCEIHDFRTAVTGDVPDEPVIFVANHLSYIDPVVVSAAVGCVPISKAEVSGWPGIGVGGRLFGVLFVDRADPMSGARVLREAMTALESGVSVLNFPEGTTTDGSGLLAFRRGIFGLAAITGTAIVPIALRYESSELCWTGDAAFLPHYLRTAARPSTTATLRFGAPIRPSSNDTAEELGYLARRRLLSLLGADDYDSTDRIRVPSPRPEPVLSATGS